MYASVTDVDQILQTCAEPLHILASMKERVLVPQPAEKASLKRANLNVVLTAAWPQEVMTQ